MNAQKVTTEDLIATIVADRDDISTFKARAAYAVRTQQNWRKFAPVHPRGQVQGISWSDFIDSSDYTEAAIEMA